MRPVIADCTSEYLVPGLKVHTSDQDLGGNSGDFRQKPSGVVDVFDAVVSDASVKTIISERQMGRRGANVVPSRKKGFSNP